MLELFQRALETQQEKLVQKEKLLNKKEKDVKKMELECNDKIQGLASSKAYIATLENQLKELKHSNHIMKVKISAMEITSEKDKENSLPKHLLLSFKSSLFFVYDLSSII
jgi:septal ring factor EnvC (AmiA/AmiB activator)